MRLVRQLILAIQQIQASEIKPENKQKELYPHSALQFEVQRNYKQNKNTRIIMINKQSTEQIYLKIQLIKQNKFDHKIGNMSTQKLRSNK